MMQPKNDMSLREQFSKISADEQQAVINYFNLHNAAIWIFTHLSDDAVSYINRCISLSAEKVESSLDEDLVDK